MAPASSPASGDRRQPTPKEAFFFLEILANIQGPYTVDWDKVATKCDYSNAGSAKVRFAQIKKALGWTAGSGGPTGIATPIKSRKRKDDGTGAVGSETKKRSQKKMTPAKKESMPDEPSEDVEAPTNQILEDIKAAVAKTPGSFVGDHDPSNVPLPSSFGDHFGQINPYEEDVDFGSNSEES